MTDPDLIIDQLVDNSQRQAQILAGLKVGDQVSIDWGSQSGHEKRGTVVQVTARLVRLRHPNGYGFSISHHELCTGVKLTVKRRKEETPMERTEYEALDKQTEYEDMPAAEVPTNEPKKAELHIPEGVDWREVLTRDKYLELKLRGHTDTWMMAACGVKYPQWVKWKEEQGLNGVKLNPNGTLHFPEEMQDVAPPVAVDPVIKATREAQRDALARLSNDQAELHRTGIEDDAIAQLEADDRFACGRSAEYTVDEIVDLVARLRTECECCRDVIESIPLTQSVKILLEAQAHLTNCEAELQRLRAGRVVV